MNHQATAWSSWLASDEGKECSNCSTLRCVESSEKYLRNRLWRAFMAGFEAGKVEAKIKDDDVSKQGERG